MSPKIVVLLCYWGGNICDGPQGISYSKSPSKAIQVQHGIQFNELINQIHVATSIDKQQYHIKVTCRYPSVVGKMMTFIPLPITDNDDIKIMFHILSRHQELSSLDLYLETKVNEPGFQTLTDEFISTNVVLDMIQNEDFNTLFNAAVMDNEISGGFERDGGKRYRMLTTNMSEIFNSVLKGARFLPITACVQLTFYRVVHYFNTRRSLGCGAQTNGSLYTPYVAAKQAASMFKASAHTLRSFNREKGIFEVVTQRGKNVQVVNLEKKTCTCGKWEANKYPCSHVLSACASLSLNSSQYVERYYTIVEYSATWAYEFSPLPHEAYWPQSSFTLLPNSDLKRKGKGRPRSTRLRNGMDIKEGKKKNLCGLCKQSGHNRKTCPSKHKRRSGCP